MAFCPFTSSKLFIDLLSFSQTIPYTLFHTPFFHLCFLQFPSLFFSMGVAASPATRNSLLSFHINLLGNLVSPHIFASLKCYYACLSDHRTRFAVIKRALMYLFLSTASCLEGNGECESLRLMSNLGQRNI